MSREQSVVITGGNTGLGYECAKVLAMRHPNWQIIIASRNQYASEAARQLQHVTGNKHVVAMPLDLASLASIRAFAADLAARPFPPLGAIVCNAGIQVVSGTTYTDDGFETTFGVNHLGHFLLVNLLLDQIEQPGRVVVVSSGTHYPDNPIANLLGGYAPRFRDPQAMAYPDRFPDPAEQHESAVSTGHHRYGTSKLCNIFFTYELARRLKEAGLHITANAFDPGLMPGTGLAREAGAFTQFVWKHLLPLLADQAPGIRRVATSGEHLARLVDDPALDGVSGEYIIGTQAKPSSLESFDKTKAGILWEKSAELVQMPE